MPNTTSSELSLIEDIKRLPETLQVDALKKFERELYKSSVMLTGRHLLGYKDLTEYTHGDVIHSLEAASKRKLIVMPRGTFKSSLCSVTYPIWLLLNNPNLRILLDGELYSNSKNFLREIKMHLTNPYLTGLFGNFKNDTCWNEGEIIINQRTKNYKEASITASGLGAEKTGQHYDVVLVDDVNSPENSNTQEKRDRVINHYRYLTSILEPEGILCIIGTRYHESDLIGWVIKNELEWGKKDEG